MHGRWKDLGRKIKSDVKDHPERYSLHYLPEPFIVPGGRFREMYYWDSYWTIQGLIVSNMPETVKGIGEIRGLVRNFKLRVLLLNKIPPLRWFYKVKSQNLRVPGTRGTRSI